MLILTAVIGLFLQFFQPAKLVLISADMSNFGALIFLFMLMYMNSKLPPRARPKGWVYLVCWRTSRSSGSSLSTSCSTSSRGTRW